jgi:hypothetical protein
MIAKWDPAKHAFVPPTTGTVAEANATLLHDTVTSPTRAPVLQVLASGKGTFIDLRGDLQSYVVMKVLQDGGISTECSDSEGEH